MDLERHYFGRGGLVAPGQGGAGGPGGEGGQGGDSRIRLEIDVGVAQDAVLERLKSDPRVLVDVIYRNPAKFRAALGVKR